MTNLLIKINILYLNNVKNVVFCIFIITNSAHNPKVVGSNPASATKETRNTKRCAEFFLVVGTEPTTEGSRGDVATAACGR